MAEAMSLEQRKEILTAEIEEWIKKDFYLVSQTDTTAQMKKDKEFSCLLFIILTAFILLPGILYLLMRKDKHVYITVDKKGDIYLKQDFPE